MTDLSEFLLARIAEDESVALAATPGPWEWDRTPGGEWGHQPPDLVTVAKERITVTAAPNVYDLEERVEVTRNVPVETVITSMGHDADAVVVGDTDADHIARWDPARVLAECDAKRRIVELHQSWPVLVNEPVKVSPTPGDTHNLTMQVSQRIAWLTQQEYRKRFGDEPPTTPILRALALPYADHADYDESWRP